MRNSAFFLGALLALSLAAVGPAVAEDPEFLMEVGTVAPNGSPWAEQLQRFDQTATGTLQGAACASPER